MMWRNDLFKQYFLDLVGRFLQMHYTGTIDKSSATGVKGKQFDSSVGRGQTFDFKLGGGQVIKGWDEGLIGLCKGAKAYLVIEPEKGYGARGAGGEIPGGATLHFDVEVVGISDSGPPEPNLFADIDISPTDGKLTKEEILAYFKKVRYHPYSFFLAFVSLLRLSWRL